MNAMKTGPAFPSVSKVTVAKYLRISNEDADLKREAKAESDSIANQRNLLTDFIGSIPELDGADVIEFCDDGWSGKNFSRPAVRDMLEKARQGKIQCIIVKDLSRFGRDYLEVGNYLSRIFPLLGIRFIAVNDGYDSIRPEDADSMETSFRTLLYDYYSRELSRKVRSAKRRKAEQGECFSPVAPYGYLKDAVQKNHLVPDPDTEETVRRIFRMAAEGQGTARIARTLNRERVPTPKQQKRLTGCVRTWRSIHEDNFWTSREVCLILRDERYTGMGIYGKMRRIEIGNTRLATVSRSEWVCVPSTHQGIVTREEFDSAQENLRNCAERVRRPSDRPLKGKIRCGICGYAMARSMSKKPYYACKTHRVTDDYACPTGRIPEKDLTDAVLTGLQIQALYAVELRRIWEAKNRLNKRDAGSIRQALCRVQDSCHALESHIRELYEKVFFGEMDKEAYLEEKKAASEKRDALRQEAEKLETELRNARADGRLKNGFVDSFTMYAEVKELTAEIVADVLQEIVIYPDRTISIVWNYRDELETLLMDINDGDDSGIVEN